MAAETDPLSIARDRIRLAYDPNLMRTAGERLMEQLATHLAAVQSSSGRVLNWATPTENIARAAHLADAAMDPVDPTELVSHFERLVHEMLSRGHNLHDPRYVGHQVPPPIPLAGLFDAVGSVTNQVMAVYEMGPWSTAVEQAMVSKLASYLGWRDDNYASLVTYGWFNCGPILTPGESDSSRCVELESVPDADPRDSRLASRELPAG